jgi:phosphatidylinositol alpha-1,6-mannosyltransferase
VRRLKRLLRAEQATMVHCGRCIPEGVMALALKWRMRMPYICFIHGEDVSTASTSREQTCLVHRVLHNAEFNIANSRSTASVLHDSWGLAEDQVRVLHPGVDTQRFVPASRNDGLRARFGWADRPVILTVGRLQKRKGHDQLIAALELVRKVVPTVLYAIVGDGEEKPSLQTQVQNAGLTEHVQFLGEVSDADLIHCYQQCDLFALPNREVNKDIEGFGMALLEAQACGKAVLAGTSGGTAETMQIPETGRVVNCEAASPLAEVLIELLTDRDLMERMGKAGRRRVVKYFDWSALSQQAAQLFGCESLAASRSAEPELAHV